VAKANLVLPNGTTVNIEGTAEEVAVLLEKFSSQQKRGSGSTTAKKSSKKKSKQNKKGSRILKISSDLDLSGGKKGQSLRDFFSQYAPSSNLERNLVFVYYLKQVAGIEQITIDHVFTCYRNIKGVKVPGHLEQSLIDTSGRKGWINTASFDDIKLNVLGINYLEHDMKKSAG
jgi:hypothetical protein